MKTTQHLITLAEKLEPNPEYRIYTATTLNEFKKALLSDRYYTSVITVAYSGMSRVIEIAYIKKNNLIKAPDFIYKLSGCDKNNRITGCGMDMLFAAQYNLFSELCPRHDYTKSMARYHRL